MFRDLPLDFARFAFPWGEPGTALERIKALAPWQVEELGALQNHLCECRQMTDAGLVPPEQLYRAAWSSGRGLYKSALLAIIAHWHVSTHLGGQTILAAASENQLRNRIFPEHAFWFGASINAHWFNVEGLKITPQDWLVEPMRKLPQEGGLGLDPGFWGVKGEMWSAENPGGFAGGRSKYGTLVLFDEADTVPAPVWLVTDGFFSPAMDYKLWFAASQMRSNRSAFHRIFYDDKFASRDQGKGKKGWRVRTMSAESMPDQAAWAADLIARFGYESDHVRTEVRGLPPLTDDDQFIPADYIRLAIGNALPPDNGEGLVFGVDFAPRGRGVIFARQGRNARDCLGRDTVTVMEGMAHYDWVEKILYLDAKYKPVYWVLDFGMATGLIDMLKRRHLNGRMVWVKFGDMPPKSDKEFGSMGAYLWGKLRDWLPGGMIANDGGAKDTLTHQLLNRGWKWSGREDNRKLMESKDDLKGRGLISPDDADALALTFFVDPPRTDRMPRGGGARRVEGAEDNPYDW